MSDYSQHLSVAREAALAAGELLRDQALHHHDDIVVDAAEAHDIKLELDRRCQSLIEKMVLRSFPDFAIYGEEGVSGNPDAEYQWIIDPIDGTVNFFYGIPHFAISIALRYKKEIVLGVIYDPMRNELWEAARGGTVTLNGHPIHVSRRTQLSETAVSVGLSKTAATIEQAAPQFLKMLSSVRKCRLMGSATLDIAYVACGRLDAYIENQISLWDIAAGVVMVEMAGGIVELKPHPTEPDKYSIVACSAPIREQLKF
ncbi:MAG: inositol monophosphatase [Verrucomicrobia bacterium]|nr:inositol monophosphatase [Verrucomicrobiota bacterium]